MLQILLDFMNDYLGLTRMSNIYDTHTLDSCQGHAPLVTVQVSSHLYTFAGGPDLHELPEPRHGPTVRRLRLPQHLPQLRSLHLLPPPHHGQSPHPDLRPGWHPEPRPDGADCLLPAEGEKGQETVVKRHGGQGKNRQNPPMG